MPRIKSHQHQPPIKPMTKTSAGDISARIRKYTYIGIYTYYISQPSQNSCITLTSPLSPRRTVHKASGNNIHHRKEFETCPTQNPPNNSTQATEACDVNLSEPPQRSLLAPLSLLLKYSYNPTFTPACEHHEDDANPLAKVFH